MKKKIQYLARNSRALRVAVVFGLIFCLSAVWLRPVLARSLTDINRDISQKKEEIERLDAEAEELETKIEEKRKEATNLQNQLEILDRQIEVTEIDIEKTEEEITRTRLEIEELTRQIQEKEKEIENQKIILAEFIRQIQEYDSRSSLELILTYRSFSDFMDTVEYMEELENQGQETLDSIQKIRDELEWQRQVLEAKKQELNELMAELEAKKNELDEEKGAKEHLLQETQAQEEKYQELLEQARKDYESTNSEISTLEAQARAQMATRALPDNWSDVSGDGSLAWPVNPTRGISAYFMDPSYRAYFGVNHYAIDIPAPQGTPMHAPADGYVVTYRNAGYGYSYIMLMHGGGISTVYGHVTQSYVSAGMNVSRGDVIGLVGGTPGTPGAGYMTTGPHLHFEVRLNGSPVDPLNYLP